MGTHYYYCPKCDSQDGDINARRFHCDDCGKNSDYPYCLKCGKDLMPDKCQCGTEFEELGLIG